MSPTRPQEPPTERARREAHRLGADLGRTIRGERQRRGWSLRQLAAACRVAPSTIYGLELGRPGGLETYARVLAALGQRLEAGAAEPHGRIGHPATDTVHAAMGELEAARLRERVVAVAIDEPYQHFQFAGRADVAAWHEEQRALLHIENRTRFPDLQEAAGAFNAKRAYLGQALAERLGISHWVSETHVIVALWSAEVMHAIRLHEASFRALCPGSVDSFSAWWETTTPEFAAPPGRHTTLVLLDPAAGGRARGWVGLGALHTVRARYHGYAEAVRALHARGQA